MLKNSFLKYLITFVTIIGVSFLLLSFIFSAMIRSYTTEDGDRRLRQMSSTVSQAIERDGIENLANCVRGGAYNRLIEAMTHSGTNADLIIISADGTVLLTTVGEDGKIYTKGDLGTLDVSRFRSFSDADGEPYLFGRGDVLEAYGASRAYAHTVSYGGEVLGYTVAVRSTASEDALIGVTRRAILSASLWVMIAAMIAVYFITERIMHPMRQMTAAAKNFARGDFTARVEVVGKDEVADLAVAFNNMAESLTNLEKMRNSFLASVSHDLRTPMTTIAGFIDGINSGAIPPEKQEYYLGVISSEIHRLSRLVAQLLNVSRIESGDRKFTFTDFDVAETARLILISFEKQIEEKRLDVLFEAPDSVTVCADKDAIYQVIYNLCHNAVKFSREGGKYRIRILPEEDKTVRISVYNEGVGIAKEDLPFVFDRFYKSDKSRGLDKSGVGLGLYICKAITDAHEGDLCVRSVEGEYCEFSFSLKMSGNNAR